MLINLSDANRAQKSHRILHGSKQHKTAMELDRHLRSQQRSLRDPMHEMCRSDAIRLTPRWQQEILNSAQHQLRPKNEMRKLRAIYATKRRNLR